MYASTTAAAALTLAALASSAYATFEVIVPGGSDLWWVANNQNNVIWTCKDSDAPAQFTILVSNSDPTVLVSAEAIVAEQDNFDCSRTLTNQQMNFKVAQNYKVILANPLNSSDVYAESDFFEIKSSGATYPAASATPSTDDSSTSASASGSGASSSASATDQSNATSAASTTGVVAGVWGVLTMVGASVLGAVAL